jgi:hypothetical protein
MFLLQRVTRDRITARPALDLMHTTVSHDVPAEIAAATARLNALARAADFANRAELAEVVRVGRYREIAERLEGSASTSKFCRTSRWGSRAMARAMNCCQLRTFAAVGDGSNP